MRSILVLLLLLAAISASRDFSDHSISVTVIPFDPDLFYPDFSYEYAFSPNDAVGFSTGIGIINRVTYTRKFSVLCLTGSLGLVIPEHDLNRMETLTAVSAEYRQPLGKHLFSRIVGSAVFFYEMNYDLPVIPILQVGFGWTFQH